MEHGISPRQVSTLPADVTSFVGRHREIAEVKRLLSASRLVTLSGIGGVGKTRLAIHVARQLQRAFSEGVAFAELGALTKPELLGLTVIQAVGLHSSSTQDSINILAEYLHDKHVLLVLDNCEHLVGECATLVSELMRKAPELRVLTTSREPLRVAGECIFSVPPLSVHGKKPSATAHGGSCEAITLFADRAEAVLPGFSVTKENQQEVVQICRRLDGVPLAIELAAVRVKALSVQQILARIDDQYRLLTEGSRTALPRHQTMRAAMDWSFALCSNEERDLWVRDISLHRRVRSGRR